MPAALRLACARLHAAVDRSLTSAAGALHAWRAAAPAALWPGVPRNAKGRTVPYEALEPRTLYSATILSVTPEDPAGSGVPAGSAAHGQRSMETQIAVQFSEPVTLSSGAFTLNLVNNWGSGTNDGSPDTALSGVLGTPTNPSTDGENWIIPIESNGTNSYALDGTHGGISGANLENGVYDLGVNYADVSGMSANYTSSPFHELFGDVDNSGRDFNAEYSALLAAYGSTYVDDGSTTYNEDLDVDGSGRVFSTAYSAFEASFGSTRIYDEPKITLTTAATASPATVTGTTVALSAAGTDNDYSSSDLIYTWSVVTAPSGVTAPTFSANGTNAAASSTATFGAAGAYTFQVTITDPAGSSVASSVSVTVDQTLTSISVTPGTATLGSDGTQTFAASALDQFGVALATQPTFTWSNSGSGSVSSSGLYTAPAAAGSDTVTATSGSVSGNASITVAGPSAATAASASVVAPPGVVELDVLGSDPNGESTLTYTWVATSVPSGASAVMGENGDNGARTSYANVDTAGTYTFEVTISDGTNSVTSSVNLTISQVATTLLTNTEGAAVADGTSETFSATVYDQFGNAMASQPSISWSVLGSAGGSVSSSGGYTAPSSGAGTDYVVASAAGLSDTVTIEAGTYVGSVFDDNGDPNYGAPGDGGYSGWTVYVDQNNDGTDDPGDESTTTDEFGNFALGPVSCGGPSQTIAVVQQSGFSPTTATSAAELPNSTVSFGQQDTMSPSGTADDVTMTVKHDGDYHQIIANSHDNKLHKWKLKSVTATGGGGASGDIQARDLGTGAGDGMKYVDIIYKGPIPNSGSRTYTVTLQTDDSDAIQATISVTINF